MVRSRHAFLSFLAVVCFACRSQAPLPKAAAPIDELARWSERAASVTITRDDWGVPHIAGKTDADAVFGLMYAQAEDDFQRIEENFLFSQGRLAEAYGEDYLWSDLRMKLFIDPSQMRTLYAQSPDSLRALMDAWADGLNYFLHTHPKVTPKVIARFEPWMALTFSEGSIGGDIERVSVDALREFYAGNPRGNLDRVSSSRVRRNTIALAASAAEHGRVEFDPSGSNGIAIAPKLSESGAALLLINPHTSFFFRHEAHVQSEQGLNAYGALTWGQFFVYQGFNESAGWMHTSSSVDNIDEFLESVVEDKQGLMYRYGAELRPVSVRTIEVPYKTQEGTRTRSFETYRTHHGPIVRGEGDRWVAVALMEEPMKALVQSYSRTKAKNLKEYLQIMEAHTNSSNNTVFADSEGNIAYLHSNFVPVRNRSLDYRFPVDGSDPASDWQGVHSVEESPNSINPETGWVQNTNNWPYSAAGPLSPKKANYPSYMDIGRENARGVHALELLSPLRSIGRDGLVEMAYDTRLPAFDVLLPPLFRAFDALAKDASVRSELGEAIERLRGWNRRWSIDSEETTLAVFWATRLIENSELAPWPAPRRPVLEAVASESTDESLLHTLQETVSRLRQDFGAPAVPWGEVNRFQRLSGDIRLSYDDDAPSTPVPFVSGYWGSLAAFGAAPKAGTKKWYGTRGNSFVAVVEFGPRVRARAVTAGGLSDSPDSPHFNDQTGRYAAGDLREVYFYPDELEGHVERRYRPGQ
ncbi:MAG: penicillin acylase family protein [Myxococcota bacterium]